MEKSTESLLKQIRDIKKMPTSKRKKRKNETDREYIFRMARCRCEYCKRPYAEKELHAVRKHPQEKFPLIYDGVCACTKCAREKGGMSHKEFLHALRHKKKEVRKEAFENGKELNRVVFERYHYTCIYCVHEFGYMPKDAKLTKDHKVPVSRGGTNDLRNLTCACKYHNLDKADRTADEYFQVIDKRKANKDTTSYIY